MAKKKVIAKDEQLPKCPVILRAHRLMEAFAKSDDERDFFLDRKEGFIVYIDLDKNDDELNALYKELEDNSDRYCPVPKLSFYETKKIMEGFVNEKVYDIDIKEKLLEIIQSKEARENFLEFIYDHHSELEKWQQFYQERSRIRIIEWLRGYHFSFVFEEDLELSKNTVEKVKLSLFEDKVSKEIETARRALESKSKTYYSNEALNPRPKRGRPPKQTAKQEVEIEVSTDLYTTVPRPVKPFLFTPDITATTAATFSAKFDSEDELLASRKINQHSEHDMTLESLNKKLASLRELSSQIATVDDSLNLNELDEDEVDFDQIELDMLEGTEEVKRPASSSKPKNAKAAAKTTSAKSTKEPAASKAKSPAAKKKSTGGAAKKKKG